MAHPYPERLFVGALAKKVVCGASAATWYPLLRLGLAHGPAVSDGGRCWPRLLRGTPLHGWSSALFCVVVVSVCSGAVVSVILFYFLGFFFILFFFIFIFYFFLYFMS